MAARNKLLSQLASDDPALYADYMREQRSNDGFKHFVHESGRYPLTSYGRLNTYSLFAEASQVVIAATGRYGLILPTGIATDSFNQHFFSNLVRNSKLVSFLGFENEAYLLSRAVHHFTKFCLLTICGRAANVTLASFSFGVRYMKDLGSSTFTMPPEEILLVNPNTGTTPVFRTHRDAEVTIGIYRRVPVFWRETPEENHWGVSFQLMFMMNTDSGLFRMAPDDNVLSLYEAKMIYHFDHHYGTYKDQTDAQANMGTLPRLTPEQRNDPHFSVEPRYWVEHAEVDVRLLRRGWHRDWLFGWRDISNATNERTMICSVIPRVATGHPFPLVLSASDRLSCLYANLASFALDYVVRQKIAGTHLTFGYIKQLPVLTPSTYDDDQFRSFIESHVLELTYTAWDLSPFARDQGDDGPPFRWDEDRRFLLRAELDAAFFHLYGIDRDDVDYIMETFPIVKRKDIAAHSTYRTKDKILEIYDAMTKAKSTGAEYQTALTPPPGQGPRHRPAC